MEKLTDQRKKFFLREMSIKAIMSWTGEISNKGRFEVTLILRQYCLLWSGFMIIKYKSLLDTVMLLVKHAVQFWTTW